MVMKTPVFVAAAVRCGGRIYTGVCHFLIETPSSSREEGFIDSHGVFYTREHASKLAGVPEFTSDDLPVYRV